MVLFANLQKLESFKAFGVEAKLRETIAEAQASLEQLKQLTLASARQTYYQLASVGRWTDGNIQMKDDLAQELGTLLVKFSVDEQEIRRARSPYVEMIRIDLMNTYRGVVTSIIHRHLAECGKTLSGFRQPINMSTDDGKRYEEVAERQSQLGQLAGPFMGTNDYSKDRFLNIVETDRFEQLLHKDEAARLKQIGRVLLKLDADCERVGHYTPEALALVQTYGPYNHQKQKDEQLLNSKYAYAE
jgi:hypothetical protein